MSGKVLDFAQKREQNIENKRRQFERVLFQNFLGAYTVIDQGGAIYPVSLVDISHDGLSTCAFKYAPLSYFLVNAYVSTSFKSNTSSVPTLKYIMRTSLKLHIMICTTWYISYF